MTVTVTAATSRDLSANREQVEGSIEDALGARLASVLSQVGFSNEAAGAYAEVLAEHLADAATKLLFDLMENDLALLAATKAA